MGPKLCSAERRCVHTDAPDGTYLLDESTLQTCGAGYVEISLFRNSSTCRTDKRVYAFNASTDGCQPLAEYYGYLTCGSLFSVSYCSFWSSKARCDFSSVSPPTPSLFTDFGVTLLFFFLLTL
jgi:hypothetical protein